MLKANNSDCETMALGLVFTDHMPFTTLFKAGKRKWGITGKKRITRTKVDGPENN